MFFFEYKLDGLDGRVFRSVVGDEFQIALDEVVRSTSNEARLPTKATQQERNVAAQNLRAAKICLQNTVSALLSVVADETARTIEAVRNPYLCPGCGERFGAAPDLLDHVLANPDCNEKFYDSLKMISSLSKEE